MILCYDDHYRHYVVFSLSPTTYFLHTDCLEPLGLDPHAAESKRKAWVLAEVVDKEYCQARKVSDVSLTSLAWIRCQSAKVLAGWNSTKCFRTFPG